MKCRSCGQVNEQRNKFCGACGSPLQDERRRSERRMIAWEPQQCRSCGSMNSAANRFCGMCGTALEIERRESDRRSLLAASSGTSRKPEPARIDRTRAAEPAEAPADSKDEATSYLGAPAPSSSKPRSEWVRSSGSSFLGLEDEAPSNSEYLFADEEPHSGGGWRVLIVLLILAAAGYLIFKNWDSPTFAAALSQLHKHTQDSSATENKPQPSTAEQPSISTDENTPPSDAAKQSTPAGSDTNQPAPDASKASPTEPPATVSPSDTDAKSSNEPDPKKSSTKAAPAKDDEEAIDSAPSEPDPKAPAAPNPASRAADTESSNPANAAIPGQELYERGQAYLNGHGAPQSCDQGVVYTRAAAQQGNPKAAVQMGALYATGRCVSQDRVQAYTWFNEALRNDPNNEYVERSRSTVWAQMTSEERQRASKEQQ
jgi:hypothetical protein